MSNKPNAYANRFSKLLNFEPSPVERAEDSVNVVQFPDRKIGAPTIVEENYAPNETIAEAPASKQDSDFAQLLDTWSIGKPAVPLAPTEDFSGAAILNPKPAAAVTIEVEPRAQRPGVVLPTRKKPEFKTIELDIDAVEPHLVAIKHPRSPHCEEYRSLRTQLLLAAERRRAAGKEMQAVVVASARPGEGKSTTALNLAWMMAQTDGVSCLVIDADLRMPSLADYLGVAEHPGLSDVFDGTVELEQAIVKLNPAGLHLLPGGTARQDIAELISGNAFRRILDKARTMFDYIIIDAPPLAIFTDAAVLINLADGAMLVVKSGKTRYATINRMLEHVSREQMLGVVLNGSKEEVPESHYNYYYDTPKKKVGRAGQV
ncbi:MAG: CpsD/CapB family tyrosine-protein kinase [Acidobacteriota bacterium]|nr:CpsD/CapB family tyrosine-protein kinase [Acidobacteriota bacterium]